MRRGLCVLGLVFFAAIGAATADEPSACLEFFDPGTRNGSEDVFLSVERLEGKHACFLIPRSVIDRRYRGSYTDQFAVQKMLVFERSDLVAYVRRGAIGEVDSNCLGGPMPSLVAIASRTVAIPETVKEALGFGKEVESDLVGYRRYSTELNDFYVADLRPEAEVSFFCWRSVHPGLCVLAGNYDGLTLALQYEKSAMTEVEPLKAMQCLRGIAQAFRITKPVQTD